MLIFPDKAGFSSVSEGDLLILLKYFISVVPRAEQVQENILIQYASRFSCKKTLDN